MKNLKLWVYAQAATLGLATVMSSAANADIVSTQSLITSDEYGLTLRAGSTQQLQDTLNAALENDEVINKLVAMGVDPSAAKDRIANLTEAEAQTLAAKLDSMPAGGNVVLLLVIIILVLLLR